MLFYDSSTYGKDIMASSTGNIQIGRDTNDTTTIMGDLIIQEPKQANQGEPYDGEYAVSYSRRVANQELPASISEQKLVGRSQVHQVPSSKQPKAKRKPSSPPELGDEAAWHMSGAKAELR